MTSDDEQFEWQSSSQSRIALLLLVSALILSAGYLLVVYLWYSANQETASEIDRTVFIIVRFLFPFIGALLIGHLIILVTWKYGIVGKRLYKSVDYFHYLASFIFLLEAAILFLNGGLPTELVKWQPMFFDAAAVLFGLKLAKTTFEIIEEKRPKRPDNENEPL